MPRISSSFGWLVSTCVFVSVFVSVLASSFPAPQAVMARLRAKIAKVLPNNFFIDSPFAIKIGIGHPSEFPIPS